MAITRRNFIAAGSLALGGTALASLIPGGPALAGTKKNLSFGFQTWTLKDQLGTDLPGTLKMMANLGYKELEFCSPLGYKGTPFEKFSSMKGTELKKVIDDSGLSCRSSHYNFGEMRDELDKSIEWSKQMGITQMICSSFWLPDGASIDEYRRSCDDLNKIGRKIKAAGMQCGFHNHHMEFEKRDGKLIYDALLDQLDPDLVKMQFQVAVISVGYKAADYFRKYPGRFISAHLADWSATKNDQVPIGQGVVDWPDFFEAAKVGGVKNFFVEMDPETFKDSASYLKSL